MNNKKNYIEINFKINLKNKKYIPELSSKYSAVIEIKEIGKYNSDLPENLTIDIFKKKLNDNLLHFYKEQAYITKIKTIIMPNESKNNINKISLSSNLKNAFGSEIIKNKKISTNDTLLNALLNQY